MRLRVINNHRQPITLESGVILAAAGTPGSTREVESITDKDRRRNAGRINIIELSESQSPDRGDPVEQKAAPLDDSDLPEPSSIAGVIARDVVRAARADARKRLEEKDKEVGE
jgi:hypothetical protein